MKKAITAVILLLCTAIPVGAILLYESGRKKEFTAEILTRAPERGNFLPRKLTVSVGKLVRLRVRNVDTVVHGFAIPALNVDAGEIKAGTAVILQFTPKKEDIGTHDFYCTVWCSESHLQMRGQLEVTP